MVISSEMVVVQKIDRPLERTPLKSPLAVKETLPATEATHRTVEKARKEIRDILHGCDNRRLIVVVGPCSIHDPAAAYEYAHKLKLVAEKTGKQLLIVMRTYFEKPRTTVGWKGLINDPDLDGSCHIEGGLLLSRRVLLEINAIGLPCATELLDTVTPQYIDDLVSWTAIGARTTESQLHREMASGLSMPVGFKNGTCGRLSTAMNAIAAARHLHSFLGIDGEGRTAIVKTKGNRDSHIVLRGGEEKPNYGATDITQTAMLMSEVGLQRGVMVDCSHDNSRRDYARQAGVCREVVQQFCEGQKAIMGVMLESHLYPGKQTLEKGKPLAYGVSITDGCMGWDETEALLYEIAEMVKG
jgi:3-deoxy-7-phosphoheptulonate synthase